MVEDGKRFFFQPCFSVVWDSGIAAYALGEASDPPKEALRKCADWLLTKEVRRKGDWSVKRPKTDPPAGISNSPTSFIRISTTPRRCCWA